MAMRLWEAAEPTNTRASATRASTTRLGFAQRHSSPGEAAERAEPVLQARLETLHGAQLLDEETLYLAEDAIADCKDLAADDKISRLIALSTKMTSDRAFARQLQRKKWL
jgi:hypothetical protein